MFTGLGWSRTEVWAAGGPSSVLEYFRIGLEDTSAVMLES
jgi:hypothetical protein